EWEIHCLFIAWGAASLLALTSRARVGWVVLFTLTGALLVALPLYNLVATDAGLFAALGRGDGMLAGIDGALLVFGLGFLAVARRVGRYRSAKPKRRRSVVPAMVLEPAQ
ncbi:MAG: PepSY domain-containing protein, partial [Tsuneonella sp.]